MANINFLSDLDVKGTILVENKIGIRGNPERELDVYGGARIRGTLDLFQGNDNTFAGTNAGNLFNIVSSTNTGFGEGSQAAQLNGNSNSSLGFDSLAVSISGNNNTAIGTNSMVLSDGGSFNTALGSDSLNKSTLGQVNTAIGYRSLYNKTTTNFNTAVGYESLFNLEAGFRNVALGNGAGKFTSDGTTANTTSKDSVFIGSETKSSAALNINEIVIGYGVIGQGSNSTTIGSANTTDTHLRGRLNIASIPNGSNATNKFLSIDTVIPGLIKYRTDIQVLDDIGAAYFGTDTIGNGNIPMRVDGIPDKMADSAMRQERIGTSSAKRITVDGARMTITGGGGDAQGGTLNLSNTTARLGIALSSSVNGGEPEASLDVGKNARVRGSLNVGATNEQYLFVSTTGDTPVGYVRMSYYGQGTDYDLSGGAQSSVQYTTGFSNGGKISEDERIMTFKLTRGQMENLDSDPKTLIAQDSNFNYIIKEAYIYQINNGGTSPVFSGSLALEYSSVTGGVTRSDIAYTVPAANWNQSRTQKRVMFFDKATSVSQVGGTNTVPRSAVILKAVGTPTPGSGSVDYYLRMRVKNIDLNDDIINNAQLITVA